jgi:anti-sigma-K factor RskA
MNDPWHEQIQRYLMGQSSAEETAALQATLNADADLRALYLDYMNLDAALDAAADAESGTAKRATFLRHPNWLSSRRGRWLAATAAGAALIILAALPTHREHSRERPEIAAAIAATQSAIARLSLEPPTPLPAWMSPTASMLDDPRFSK